MPMASCNHGSLVGQKLSLGVNDHGQFSHCSAILPSHDHTNQIIMLTAATNVNHIIMSTTSLSSSKKHMLRQSAYCMVRRPPMEKAGF